VLIFDTAGWGGWDWIDLAEDKDSWRAFVKAVNELSGSIKIGEFLDYLRNCLPLRKDSVPCS
jgi:hypothetical protein